MLKGGEILDIVELHGQGHSIRQIAKLTRLSRNTVRKALTERRVWTYKPRPAKGSKLDAFKPYLEERLAVGVTNAVRLLAEIRDQGYTGGYTLVRQFLQNRGPPAKPVATVRFETRPGEQAQVDFGTFTYEREGKLARCHAFVMVLSYSRMIYVEFVERQDLSTFIRCHVHAFEALGIAQTILYDNIKVVVLGRNQDGTPQLNTRFTDFALALGFRPRLCRPYRAQTKGRVERTVGYLRQSFWPRTFVSLNDLNQQVRTWCEDVANRRIHATTGQRPCELWQKEPLGHLPELAVVARFLTEERKVGRDGYVQFGGSRYGVPWQYAGQTVEIRESAAYIEMLVNGQQIAVHPRALMPKSTLTLPGQWEGLQATSTRPVGAAVGMQVDGPDVDARPLALYAQFEGGEHV
jgi:transposase